MYSSTSVAQYTSVASTVVPVRGGGGGGTGSGLYLVSLCLAGVRIAWL